LILGQKWAKWVTKHIMARAKRHYIPEQIWHLAHRCHKREFLLKLVKDKRRWLQWLFDEDMDLCWIVPNAVI
jgi:hypothetical protein